MTEEFNLSEKMIERDDVKHDNAFFWRKDVKNFIKKLKEEMHKTQTGGSMITIFSMETIIDKLAGEELVK